MRKETLKWKNGRKQCKEYAPEDKLEDDIELGLPGITKSEWDYICNTVSEYIRLNPNELRGQALKNEIQNWKDKR